MALKGRNGYYGHTWVTGRAVVTLIQAIIQVSKGSKFTGDTFCSIIQWTISFNNIACPGETETIVVTTHEFTSFKSPAIHISFHTEFATKNRERAKRNDTVKPLK